VLPVRERYLSGAPPVDALVRRLFGVGLGLHVACLRIDDPELRAAMHVILADLDTAINGIRHRAFDASSRGS
jgi:hypothetical protein